LRATQALDALASAERYAEKLCTEWARQDYVVLAALHAAAIIDYSKAFEEKPPYPVRHLYAQKGFDQGLHRHILKLRQKLVAHTDDAYTGSDLGLLVVGVHDNEHDATVQVPQAAHVRVTTLHSISSEELAKSCLAHISATVKGANVDAANKAKIYISQALLNPNNLDDLNKSSGAHLELNFNNSNEVNLPPLDSFAPAVQPEVLIERDGYVYRIFRVSAQVLGEFKIRLPSGREVTVSIKDAPTQAKPAES
jgi:hypothetical protein